MDHDKFRSARRGARGRRRDGDVDAQDLFQDETRRRTGYADQRLCAQAFEVLSLLINGGLGDPALAALRVEAVEPAPDAHRLMVTLRLGREPDANDIAAVRSALERVRGLARYELAAAIVRKRAPEVMFQLLGPTSASGEESP